MHIALVNQWYPPTGYGGVAMHNVQLAEACHQLGHRVTVITARNSGDLAIRDMINGVNIIRVSPTRLDSYRRRIPLAGRYFRFLDSMIYSYRVNRALAALHASEPVDVAEFAEVNAEGFFWRAGYSMAQVLRCHTPMFVLRKYSTQEIPYATEPIEWAEKHVLRRVPLMTTPSKDMASVISSSCDIPTDRILPIPNILDTELFSPAKNRGDKAYVSILHVGRFERAKGIELLVQAIPQVCRACPYVRFVMIGHDRPRRPGKGTYREYVEQELADFINSGQLHVIGDVPQGTLIEAYRAADIVVVPTIQYESFSYTCAQAMACALPVVASRIGGIPETLDFGRCGILVDPGDTQQIAEGLIQLCQNEDQRRQMGEAGRERAEKMFSKQIVASRILSFYERALADAVN